VVGDFLADFVEFPEPGIDDRLHVFAKQPVRGQTLYECEGREGLKGLASEPATGRYGAGEKWLDRRHVNLHYEKVRLNSAKMNPSDAHARLGYG
jgi:hypothetical protein